MVKSFTRPGRLYSYGPRYATGIVTKFPCGGGDGAVHSRVVASHGLSFTFLPCLMLQKKLMMNGIWARPMIQAAQEIGVFHRKAVAHNIGTVNRIDPPQSEMKNALRIITDGIEISRVVVWKNALTVEPIPVSHM